MEINDYPETDHPPIEDIVDDLADLKIEILDYPETHHPPLEDIYRKLNPGTLQLPS